MKIVYLDTETNTKYLDFQMVKEKFKVSKSKMHRLKLKLPENSYIVWKGNHLFDEKAIEKLQEIIQEKPKRGSNLSSPEKRRKLYEILKTEFENQSI